MPNVIGYHDVTDRDHWLSSDLREKKFGELGITNIRTFIDPTNPHAVGVSGDVPDLDAFMAWLQSEDGAAAAASDGVVLDTVVLLVVGRAKAKGENHLRRHPPVQGRNQAAVRRHPSRPCTRVTARCRAVRSTTPPGHPRTAGPSSPCTTRRPAGKLP